MVKRTLKYDQLTSNTAQMLLQKLSFTPTTVVRAKQLKMLTSVLKSVSEGIREEFHQKIVPQFAELNEDGSVRKEKDGNFMVPDGKEEDFIKAQEAFGKKEFELELPMAIPLDAFSDIKMTASDIEWLGDFVSEESGPGLPAAGPIPLKKA